MINKFKLSIAIPFMNAVPSYKLGALLIRINNQPAGDIALKTLRNTEREFKLQNGAESMPVAEKLIPWFDAYAKLGLNIKNFPPSAMALGQRILSGKELPDVNPLINILNSFSVANTMPIGAHDLQLIDNDIEVRFSQAGDKFNPLGKSEIENLTEGHPILAAGDTTMTNYWVWRQSNQTKITEQTKLALVLLDTVDGRSTIELNELMDELVATLGGGIEVVDRAVLSHSQLNHEFSIGSSAEEDNIKLSDLKAVTDEILGENDLLALLASGERINHYIGFEISGLVHLGTGLMTGIVIRELQKLGIHTRIFLADWHTWINDKLEGDRELIKLVAEEYFGPAMRISAQIAGADPDKIEFIHGTDLYHNNDSYWQGCVDIAKHLTLSRVRKSTTIMGREDSDSMDFAKLFYPIMQVADIYAMQNQIAHAGTDQRKAHVIAREVATDLTVAPLMHAGRKLKPISIHHQLVSGLNKPAQWPLPTNIDTKELLTTLKMSKSVAGSAIFVQDSEEEIRAAIRQAFCPEKEVGYNPVLNWTKLMLFPILGELKIARTAEHGGNLTVGSYAELEQIYASGELHPLDLKNCVADALVELLRPARELFANEESQELIERIRNIKKKR